MSRVIRGGADDEPATARDARVVPKETFDARTDAERILETAREEAAAIVRAARDEAAAVRDAARGEGLAAGRAEAATLIASVQAAEAARLGAASQDVARLALAAAERIVGAAVAAEPARIAAIVEDVLSRARRATEIVVRCAPEDAAELERAKERLRERAGVHAPFVVRPDPTIARGGCVVETNVGRLDARVEVQIAALARALGVAE